ncbi:MAG: hypothetical protein HKN25_14280 [Pyrinomonadaceae bacterium]|nr:hypothetical protein [Pyrinomonadaceae bacterium]
MNPSRTNLVAVIILLAMLLITSACLSENGTNRDSANVSPTKTPLSELDRELRSLRTVDFDYIFSFKRKDGEAFSREDKKFLKEQTFIANRRSLLKDEKTILIGSNYEIEKKRLDALKERFEFEDFSKPPEKQEKVKRDADSGADKDQKSGADGK